MQVWFQNRRQKWKTTQISLGHSPPSLKDVSARLASLEQLLPYASGQDAQRAFAPSLGSVSGGIATHSPPTPF